MFPTYPIISVDPDGLLWVLGVVPDWDLREETQHTFDPQLEEAPPIDGRLEVIDPDAGRVLASALIEVGADDPFNSILAGTSSVFTSVEDSVGLTTLEIRDLRLVRK